MKNNCENGRSMIEMLGVLSIIGVLTMGGFNILTTALNKNKVNAALTEISQLTQNLKKMACQYDDGYSDYTTYLIMNKAYPATMQKITTTAGKRALKGAFDINYSFAENAGKITMTMENVPEEVCVEVLSTSWGKASGTGFEFYTLNDATEKYSTPQTMDVTTTVCAKKNKIVFQYVGC